MVLKDAPPPITPQTDHIPDVGKMAPAHSMDKEVSQFLADVMTAAGLVSHGKQCKELGERLRKGCMNLRNNLAIPEQVQLKKERK